MLAKMVQERAPQNYHLHLYDLPEFDMTDRGQVLQEIRRVQPDVIINCAAFTDVDGCETEIELANRVNGTAVGYLAEAAKKADATLVHISTDYLFDGRQEEPYSEEDRVNPQSAYGRSKLLGEQAIMDSGLKKYFIVRTSWLYGPGGKNFVETILRLAGERQELKIVADQVGSPTYTADLADAKFELIEALDIAPVHLVGHSAGGHTALLAALRRPDLVRSLVLEEGGFVDDHPVTMTALTEIQQVIGQFMRLRAAGDREAAVRVFLDTVSGEGFVASQPASIRRVFLDNEPASGLRASPPLSCRDTGHVVPPVLVVLGGDSPPIMDRILAGALECLPGTEIVTIAGASHGIHYQQPAAFNRAVLGFIGRQSLPR